MASNPSPDSKSDKLHRIYEMEGRNTSSTDPKMMESRLFIGNLASDLVTRQDVEQMFEKYGKILGVSLHKSFGFVQFDTKESAENAVNAEKGHILKGLKMDLCIATERRKNPPPNPRGRRPPPRTRSRSPRRRRDREWERDRDRWAWPDRRPSTPPPRYRGDPYSRDPFYPRDDPYFRDDPYGYPPLDPYDRYPPPPRGYPRDYPPPRRGDRFDMDPWEEERFSRERDRLPPLSGREEGLRGPLLPKPVERKSAAPEMEIIVVSHQQKEYAQMVRQQVESAGVLVEMKQLSPTFSLLEALDNASKRGFLYTIIISNQHETHRSVTLTILHGRNPQEHKNMPLADAIGLIERDYDRYSRSSHITGRTPPRGTSSLGLGGSGLVRASESDDVSSLMTKAAAGGSLSSTELNALITTLQQKQRHTEIKAPPVAASQEDIQQQQADLQAKILSLLGSSAVVPSAASKGVGSQQSSASTDRFGGLGRFVGGAGTSGYGSNYQSSFGSFN